MATLQEAFGNAVRALRTERGIAQERLAAIAGLDRAFMSRIERGKTNAALATMAAVAEGLEIGLDTLFAEVERQRRGTSKLPAKSPIKAPIKAPAKAPAKSVGKKIAKPGSRRSTR